MEKMLFDIPDQFMKALLRMVARAFVVNGAERLFDARPRLRGEHWIENREGGQQSHSASCLWQLTIECGTSANSHTGNGATR
jgi:hypothetical protein